MSLMTNPKYKLGVDAAIRETKTVSRHANHGWTLAWDPGGEKFIIQKSRKIDRGFVKIGSATKDGKKFKMEYREEEDA